MRKLKLYNSNKTSYIDFNNNKYLVTDISGLGTSYEFKKLEKAIYDIEQSFENIFLTVNFGIKSNAYNDYKSFLDFIASNGKKKFILGYDYGLGERFTDVYIKSVPKTQKTNFNVITENVVFERLTPWYEEVEVTSPGDGNPFELDIVNNHIMPIPLKIETTDDVEELDLKLHYAGEFSRNLLLDSGSERIADSSNETNGIYYGQNLTYLKGETVTLSFEAKSTEVSDTLQISLAETIGRSTHLIDIISFTEEFVRYEYTFIVTIREDRPSIGGLWFNNRISNYPNNIGNIFIKNVKLERGDKATEWSPAPEDYDSEVGRVKVISESGYNLLIDSENKKVELFNSSGSINGYDNIDHTYNSFLQINRGAHVLKDENGLPLKISYKKWVAD